MDASQELPITSLRVNSNQPRKHYSENSIRELGESMLKVGQIQAIGVRKTKDEDDVYEIIYGERRFRAAELVKIPVMECKILQVTDEQIPDIQLIENLQRENLMPLDESVWLQQLKERNGCTDEQLAERVGKPVAYVTGRLKLGDLTEPAKEKVAKGILPVNAAIRIAMLPNDQQELALKKLIIPVTLGGENSEVYDGQRSLKSFFDNEILTPLRSADFDTKDHKLLPCGSCTLCPKRSGNSLFGDIMDAEQCPDRACYHEKSVTHYQQLQFNLEKKKKTEVLFVERHYAASKSFKDLGALIAFEDYENITEAEAKGNVEARYAIYVGVSNQDENRIRHGWIKLKPEGIETEKADKKKKDALAKEKAERLSDAEEKIVKINVYKKFVEQEQDNQGLMFVDLAGMLWGQIDHVTTPWEIIKDIIDRYELTFKKDVFDGVEWNPVTIDKKYVKPDSVQITIENEEFREAVEIQILAKKQFAFLCDLQFVATASRELNSTWLKTMDIDLSKIRENAATKAKEVVKEVAKAKKQPKKAKATKPAKKKK